MVLFCFFLPILATAGGGKLTTEASQDIRMSDEDPKFCDYVFDPVEWGAKTGSSSSLSEDILDDDGVWRCPHESYNDYDRCLFHLPPDRTDDAEVRDRFLAKIERPGRAPKQFIDARFGSLNLA